MMCTIHLTAVGFLGLLLLGAAGLACSGSEQSDPGSSEDDVRKKRDAGAATDELGACAVAERGKNAAGDDVVLCKQPFAKAPMIHLPADTKSQTTVKFYGGVTVPTTMENIPVIWDRNGAKFVGVDANGAPMRFTDPKQPAGLHAPTNRVTYTIYEFEGALGGPIESPDGQATSIRLSNVRAAVSIDPCAFDSRLLGAWEGTVSERLATPEGSGQFATYFDESKKVPIHITFDSTQAARSFADYAKGVLSDGAVLTLRGTIDNFDKAVKVGRKTYPSLSALGARNPFLGASDAKIELYRLGNMHGLKNDGHWVFTYPGGQNLTLNGMSNVLREFTAPWFLMTNPPPELDELSIFPHIPYRSNGHVISIHPVSIGAQMTSCH